MTKDDIQQQAVDYSKLHNFLLLQHSTGIGKSLSTIKIIEEHGGEWYIVIAELLHKQNWIDEFKKHNKEHLLKHIKFFCYASLHKYTKGVNYILDEAHHTYSDKRYILLAKLKANRIIFLSATLTKSQIEKTIALFPKLFIYKFSLSKAIEENILPEPKIYLIECKLDELSKIHKYQFSKDKHIMCTEREYYNRLSERIEFLKSRFYQSRFEAHKVQWLSAGNNRKKFLAKCKTRYARQLLRKLGDKRLICFTNSIEQSETLSMGSGAIHSKMGKEVNEQSIISFNQGNIDRLFVVGMLREGVNLNNIKAGVIVQLDNQEKSLLQMTGRSLRSIAPEMFVLYVSNTQDETYVTTSFESINKDLVTLTTIEKL
jgi:superfamily II DNA or RNA helicase